MENTAARKRKQVPEGYLVIGVDPHKKKFLEGCDRVSRSVTIRQKVTF